jgi:hypothetical protein
MAASPTTTGAVYTLLAADATVQSLAPSGVWLDEVPGEFAAPPWVVLRHQGETPQYTSELPVLETTTLRVECYASRDPTAPASQAAHPAEACERLARAVTDVLDRAVMNVQDAGSVSLVRTRYKLSLDPRRGPDDERVYRADIDYSARIQRNLPR